MTEVYRLSDTTNIDVNRQNAKAYCMLKEYGTAVKRYESLKELGDRSFLTLYYLGVSHYGDNWFYGAYDNLKEAYQKKSDGCECALLSGKSFGTHFLEKGGCGIYGRSLPHSSSF